jgi:hypothetical protein
MKIAYFLLTISEKPIYLTKVECVANADEVSLSLE